MATWADRGRIRAVLNAAGEIEHFMKIVSPPGVVWSGADDGTVTPNVDVAVEAWPFNIRQKTYGSAAACETAMEIAIALPDPDPEEEVDPLYTDSLFASTSFWYDIIPQYAPLHPDSSQFVSEFFRQMATAYGHVSVNIESFCAPVYTIDPGEPTIEVIANPYVYSGLQPQWLAVPLPEYAVSAPGSDAEMCLYQPSTDTIWEFWKMRFEEGEQRAKWGGRLDNVSTSDGIWPPPYGTTATGLPFLGGQITAEELRRGRIKHVMGFSLVNPADYRSWPALRSDGSNWQNAAFPIPEGLRFRLDPTLDIDAMNIHPVAKIISKAGQKYGFVVWDGSGVLGLRCQSLVGYIAEGGTDPYYYDIFGDFKTFNILEGIPWWSLQFMPFDYGKPA